VEKTKFILDRIEGDKAVLIGDRESLIIPIRYLKGAKEGDAITIIFELSSSKKDEKRVKKLLGDIFENKN
jgi:hypothetical protein